MSHRHCNASHQPNAHQERNDQRGHASEEDCSIGRRECALLLYSELCEIMALDPFNFGIFGPDKVHLCLAGSRGLDGTCLLTSVWVGHQQSLAPRSSIATSLQGRLV